MAAQSKKGNPPAHQIDEATKKEVQRLLGMQSDAARFSGLSLFLKIASGYVAMALFTMAAVLFSAYHLYSMNQTAFTIAKVHLPVLSAVSKMRASLLAQEGFAGKYAILKDTTFVQLFRQRDLESRRTLSVLEGVSPVEDVQRLKRQYLEYQTVATGLFSGARSPAEVNAAANGVIDNLDTLYLQRQQQLQGVLERADEQRISTIGWTVVISGVGFLLALAVAVLVTLRILKSLRKMERVTHRLSVTTFNGAGPQGALSADAQISARLKDLEQRNFTGSGEMPQGGEESARPGEQVNR